LVEVLCAILILGIGLVGLTQGIATALNSSKDSETQTAAALIAAGVIETLRAEGYIIDGEQEGECGPELPLYRWKEKVASTDIDGLHEVTVMVENAKSGQGIYELQTLLFDPPLTLASQDSSTNERDSSKSRSKDRRRR